MDNPLSLTVAGVKRPGLHPHLMLGMKPHQDLETVEKEVAEDEFVEELRACQ